VARRARENACVGLAVYIHFPYCIHKCPYCDFNTYAVRNFPEQRYADTLIREIDHAAAHALWNGRPVASVFFGGGTPSLLEPATVGRILERLAERFGFEQDAEITLEANPGSLEGGGRSRLAGFRSAGVNRISFGVQSFAAHTLKKLGRIHDATDSARAVDAARQAGFENLSCDLMFAVPGQTLEEWQADLDTLIALGSEHVSAYNLTYEAGTPLTGLRNAGRVTPADEELERSMYERTIDRLAAAGFERYEISNFARPGRRSRHNLAYWTWSDYLGLGAGAHGFHSGTAATGDTGRESWGHRYANVRLPETYMSAADGEWAASSETLDREMAMSERILLELRLTEGLDESRFAQCFGTAFESVATALPAMVAAGLVERADGHTRLTREGLMLGDAVITRLAV
jgi:putative oxygen-independent coproporphyrinogen III oxidase